MIKGIKYFLVSPKERRARKVVFVWYIITALVLFGVLSFFVSFAPYFPIDLYFTHKLQQSEPLTLTALMIAISWIGYLPQMPLIVLFISMFVFLLGLRREAIFTLCSGFISAGVAVVVKEVINRPRPSQELVSVLQRLTDSSFPSVHTMMYTTFFGFLGYLAIIFVKQRLTRNVILSFLVLLIVLVGPSRIYLGAHWLSDVLGAYLLGSVLLLVSVFMYRRGK